MRTLCISGDAAVVEQVEACAAAVGCAVQVVADVAEARRWWRGAEVLLIGHDAAAAVAAAGLPAGPRCRLIGSDQATLLRWSAVLAAPVLLLPDQATSLSGVLAASQVSGSGGAVVRLVGGSGGVGVSTLTAALAVTAARAGRRVAAVELAVSGGGLDLVFGAEQQPGWRWPELNSAHGHLPDLSGRLPQACGVDVVSAGRTWVPIRPVAAQAVLASLARTHDLVLVDAGRGESGAAALPGSTTWLMVAAEVRSVMAAKGLMELAGLTDVALVLRRGAGRHLDSGEIAAALSSTVVGQVGDDASLATSAEAGQPPGVVRASRWRRRGVVADCRRLLNQIAAPTTTLGVAANPVTAELKEADRPTVSTRLRTVAPRRSAGALGGSS